MVNKVDGMLAHRGLDTPTHTLAMCNDRFLARAPRYVYIRSSWMRQKTCNTRGALVSLPSSMNERSLSLTPRRRLRPN